MKKLYPALALVIALGIGVGGGLLSKKPSDKSSSTTTMSDHSGMTMSSSKLINLTGEAYDKEFITMMSEHHAGAIAMANMVKGSSKPEIQKLANDIVLYWRASTIIA